MVKQERAARTRRTLVGAAAAQFDQNGYKGTSLVKVTNAAGISVGALTFHFSTKAELADATLEEGREVTRDVVERAVARQAPALTLLGEMTVALVRLLEEDVVVRAAARLPRELPDAADWASLWLPEVRRLARLAHEAGELRRDVDPEDVVALAGYLVLGTELVLSAGDSLDEAGAGFAALRVEHIWQLARQGLATTADP